MMLTRYGRREWMMITAGAIVLGAVFAVLGWWWVAGGVGVVCVALLAFFRDPPRRVPTDLSPGVMLSPADGHVSAIERVESHEATDGPAVIVRIFLSVLDVHVNRAPHDADVVALRWTPGRFLSARTERSAHENECHLITLRLANGERIGVRQVAGRIARRIVAGIEVGDHLARGQKFGMIKFGSTTELILPRPDDCEVHVAMGERVRGGLTHVATLPLAIGAPLAAGAPYIRAAAPAGAGAGRP